jgi:hypothetical protein
MPLINYFIYIASAILIAYVGKDRKFGFWGYFFASLLFTPFIGILLVLASDKKKTDVEVL